MTGEKMWWFGPMGEQPQTSPIVFGDFAYAVGFGGAETWEQDTTFRELDRNHDDVVDQQEFPDSWGGISGSVLDGNGDGVLTLTEWKAFGSRIHGGGPSALVAIRLNGSGQIGRREALWRFTKSLPGISSPLFYQGILYLARGGGVITALNPEDGQILKQDRLTGVLDDIFASPVASSGNIYIATAGGKVAVLKAGKDWQVLAVNDLGEDCMASPALTDNRIYVRTTHSLFAFGLK